MVNDNILTTILPKVSRTFALTIIELPQPLNIIVGYTYLLCRICDTIEDAVNLTISEKNYYFLTLDTVLQSNGNPQPILELARILDDATSVAEKELLTMLPQILTVLDTFPRLQQQTIKLCLHKMIHGMNKFAHKQEINTMQDLYEYCYYVAGVVGELLTAFFCEHIPNFKDHSKQLQNLGIAFANGLQLTNILKDLWLDLEQNRFWLPKNLCVEFKVKNLDLQDKNFHKLYKHLVRIAYLNLRKALAYTLMIPKTEIGIRKFCLWAIWFAICTLNIILQTNNNKKSIKISRKKVYFIMKTVNFCLKNNVLLNIYFYCLSCRLFF